MDYSKKNFSKKIIKGKKTLNLFFSKSIFLGSFSHVNQMLYSNKPECCFIGRSNVGKSSLINAITKSKKLAKKSKNPGRTQSINLYGINNKINLIDLPGYGYAVTSKIKREQLSNLINNYIELRINLKKIYILIDCKIGLKNSDIDMLDLITNSNKLFEVILTKVDKCSNNFIEKQHKSILTLLKNYSDKSNNLFISSIKNNEGITDIQKDIYTLTKINEI